MVTKLISLTAAITAVDIGVRSRMDAAAPLYYFVSNRLWVNIIMLIIVSLTVAVSFKRGARFKSWYSYAGCLGLAGLLIFLGGLGTFYSNFNLDGWNLLLPLNFVMLLECGVVLAICGLSYKHAKRPAEVSLTVNRFIAPAKSPALMAVHRFRMAYQVIRGSGIAAASPQRRHVRA